MRVYDCFLFFNELDLLEIRLSEMDESVDVFVLVEAPVTFTGNHKPLYFKENRERFTPWLPKIRHLVVEDTPNSDNPWNREYYQREQLRKEFEDALPNDLILICDVDEIVSRDGISRLRQETKSCYVETVLFYHSLNLITATARKWSQTFAGPKSEIDLIRDFSEKRRIKNPNFGFVGEAGWHFSSIGSVTSIMMKLSSISENSPQVLMMNDREYLERHTSARTLFFTGEKLININPEDGFPVKIMEDVEKYCELGMITNDYAEGENLFTFIERAQKEYANKGNFIPELLDPSKSS